MTTDLITCAACNRSLSKLADACPSCGHPNSWRHPLVESFVRASPTMQVAVPFTYTYTKTTISGTTAATAPLSAKFMAACLIVGPSLAALMGSPWWYGAIGGLAAAVLLITSARADTFYADVENGVWQSTDDYLFIPVRAALQMEAEAASAEPA